MILDWNLPTSKPTSRPYALQPHGLPFIPDYYVSQYGRLCDTDKPVQKEDAFAPQWPHLAKGIFDFFFPLIILF